jgi:hypothetical protein
MRERLGDFSIREKNLWIEFLVDIGVALYYWPKAFALMRAGDALVRGVGMVDLIINTVMLAIFIGVVLSVFVHTQQKPEPMDERDYLIAARSSVWSGRVLVACIVLIMGYAVIQELGGAVIAGRALLTLTPLLIAHLLLVALMLSSMTASLLKLYFYRLGY